MDLRDRVTIQCKRECVREREDRAHTCFNGSLCVVCSSVCLLLFAVDFAVVDRYSRRCRARIFVLVLSSIIFFFDLTRLFIRSLVLRCCCQRGKPYPRSVIVLSLR